MREGMKAEWERKMKKQLKALGRGIRQRSRTMKDQV